MFELGLGFINSEVAVVGPSSKSSSQAMIRRCLTSRRHFQIEQWFAAVTAALLKDQACARYRINTLSRNWLM